MRFSDDARVKFIELIARRANNLHDPQWYLERARLEPKDTTSQHAIGRFLGLRDTSAISTYSIQVAYNTQAFLIAHGDEVVEVMTRTGYLRMINKRWDFAGGQRHDGGRDGERFSEAYKQKHRVRVGGGLMRGSSNPRVKKQTVISTHALRPIKS